MNAAFDQSAPPAVMQLKWEQRDGNLVVTPNDQDRFMVKIGKAIEILRQNQHYEQFSKQFSVLVKRLACWLEEHGESWDRAFLTARESTLRFIVVRKQVEFQDEITDALSDLGVEIANDPDLDLIKLSTRALPLVSNESLQSFLDHSFTIEFNGDGTRAHRIGQQKS
ncbi:MAG TPA: hypothetical protein VNH11_30815 [Pirellulales bacterium]|nr:hypothetical protein [Pirellulales bacterium]